MLTGSKDIDAVRREARGDDGGGYRIVGSALVAAVSRRQQRDLDWIEQSVFRQRGAEPMPAVGGVEAPPRRLRHPIIRERLRLPQSKPPGARRRPPNRRHRTAERQRLVDGFLDD